ncbi:siderophore biosynthesis protein IucA [Actinocatenispora thailandica]|uniref:Siderophore biosynthesis protein IucA n=1 Tax=Actinocatenispora thailandica TaxID=227318 RepID=A0A7R7HVB2_9ACTN|nr:IucA/IucC family protein [Actinocatenispora thailandica]BCJ32704.1 siderophore biosynthesis protein IucA [Actinocatenispora thailandica]
MTGERWRRANRTLAAKALAEWCYEGMLTPVELDADRYRIDLDGDVSYEFAARRGAFGSLRVAPDSIRRYAPGLLGNRGGAPAWDVQRLVVDAAATMGVDAATLAGYLGELSATLAADATADELPAATLRALDHTELEGHLTGHPWLVTNKGRIGFGATDLRRYAPESRRPTRLRWVAVHRGLATFAGTPGLSEHAVRRSELGERTEARFAAGMRDAGLDPDAYVWLPVHPWQWDRHLSIGYAGEIAQRRIVPLGDSPDRYLAQQSIRTMTNLTDRQRYDVKLPLSILNTSVWRGIPPHCTAGAPVLTGWLQGLVAADEALADTVLLGEVASVTVHHPYLSGVDGVPYRHLETLGCIWREPVTPALRPGEHARPLAALLHVDGAGRSLLAELVSAAGRPPVEWLAGLIGTVLRPLVRLLYRYGLTVNPHGQNALVTFDTNELPCRLLLKDLVDDLELSDTVVPERLPEPAGIVPRKAPALIAQHVVDSVLIGHFRYLAPLCAEQLGVPEARFWAIARETIRSAQREMPELAPRFDEYQLLGPTFPRYRLNADRLLVTGYADRPLRHAIGASGQVPNPLYGKGS